jgi:hypothetical protein
VSVFLGPEGLSGVVEMQVVETFRTERVLYLSAEGVQPRLGRNVVAGGGEVTGVQTDPDALVTPTGLRDHPFEVARPRADGRPLASGVLQQEGDVLEYRELRQSGRDVRDPPVPAGAGVGARVEIDT